MTVPASADELVGRALLNVRATLTGAGEDGFPFAAMVTDDGHRWALTHGEFWTEGLWLGQLWWAYEHSGDQAFLHAAESLYERIRHRRHDPSTHDLGFLFVPSALRAWKVTGHERYRLDAIEAARTLTGRYDPECQVILAWDVLDGVSMGRVAIIDTLVNLQLLYWAFSETRDARFDDVARSTLDAMIRLFVRADGSTRQMVRFEGTGCTLRAVAARHQGYGPESCWSRGLGWGIYGLASAYEHLADERYLDTAQRLIACYQENAPEGLVPLYDFADPAGVAGAPRDSSAATITAAGLATLWRVTGHERYGALARAIIGSLVDNGFFVADEERAGGLIAHGCFHYPKGLFIDAELVFGDYYFLEALTLLQSDRRSDARSRAAT